MFPICHHQFDLTHPHDDINQESMQNVHLFNDFFPDVLYFGIK